MIVLPPIREVCLQSFGVVMGLFAGLLIGILSSLLGISRPFILGVGVASAVMFPGLLWPQMLSLAYRAWNKFARIFAGYARVLLAGICFYIIFVTVGRSGAALRPNRSPGSRSQWIPRETLAPAAYSALHAVPMKRPSEHGWISDFLLWASRSGNLWVVCLLPFLILLSVLETDDEGSFPSGIYTLF